jgi:four helix bundle protein
MTAEVALGSDVAFCRSSIESKTYKFQDLEIYQLALEYIDLIYELAQKLPKSEDFNLKSQITRAATSIALNIAEGSTSQSDAEQSRFLGMALRSFVETVACQDIIERRKYLTAEDLRPSRELGAKLFAKIQSMKRFLKRSQA